MTKTKTNHSKTMCMSRGIPYRYRDLWNLPMHNFILHIVMVNCDICSASVTVVLCTESYDIGPCYDGAHTSGCNPGNYTSSDSRHKPRSALFHEGQTIVWILFSKVSHWVVAVTTIKSLDTLWVVTTTAPEKWIAATIACSSLSIIPW